MCLFFISSCLPFDHRVLSTGEREGRLQYRTHTGRKRNGVSTIGQPAVIVAFSSSLPDDNKKNDQQVKEKQITWGMGIERSPY